MQAQNTYPRVIYNFIDTYWKEHGSAPSPDEIAQHIGLSDNTTRNYLQELQSWGAIDWTPNKRRTIRITGECPRVYT